MVQNVKYFNGPPSHVTLPFEYRTPILSGIHMFGIQMVTVLLLVHFRASMKKLCISLLKLSRDRSLAVSKNLHKKPSKPSEPLPLPLLLPPNSIHKKTNNKFKAILEAVLTRSC